MANVTDLKHKLAGPSPVKTILLVDGYNIVGAWPKLARLRDRESLEASRSALIEQLVNFTAFRGYRTILVFDAQMVASPLSREVKTEALEICFTDHDQTADTFIEQYSYNLLKDRRLRVIVATSDRAQQILVLAQGADWLSADSLRREVEAAHKQMRENLKRHRSQPTRKLADQLDPKVLERFSQWRCGD